MRRALVARLDNNGDVLLAGPALRAVAADAEVIFLCGPRGQAAAELLPGVARILTFEAPWIVHDPPPVRRQSVEVLIRRVAALRIDEAIILTSFHQSPLPLALLLRMANVPCIAAVSEDYAGSLLDVRHRIEHPRLHEVERALSLVATLGHTLPAGDDGRLRVSRSRWPSRGLGLAGPYVAVHPGASAPARAWASTRNAELVNELVRRGHRVVVTGAPTERTLTACVAGAHDADRVVDLGGRTDFAQLAEVLEAASVAVVGNTGPAHLAAAVGTPVVSLFAPTVDAAVWAPYGVRVELVGDQTIPCAGCRARVCPIEGHPCIDNVMAAEVADRVEAMCPAERVTA